jgi:asparagine synthase (glutamine-hydrolysing)
MFRAPLDGFFLDQRLPYVDELLSEASIKKAGYFDPRTVSEWRSKCKDLSWLGFQRQSAELGLVAVLATQLWHHTYIDPTLANLPDWRSIAGVPKEWSDLDFAESRTEDSVA